MPRPVGPSGNVPSRPSFVSGTADTMDRQIKKKKQEVYQQTLANLAKLQQDEGGGGFGFGDALKMAGGFVLSPLATATDIAAKPFELIPGVPDFQPENAGSFNLFVEGYRGIDAGLRRAAGDIAAIPGVGEPSASPTASDIRNYGVLEGVARAGVDYGNLAAAAYPAVRAGATSVGVVAPKPVPYKPMTTKQIPETAPTTPYRTTRAALAEDMVTPVRQDVIQSVREPILEQPRRRFLNEEEVLSVEELAKQRMERETKKALEEGVTSTRRAADYEKMFEGQMGTARPDTNWASVDLMNERDINNWLVDPMDVAILPESLQLKAQAQQAFRAELLPFLKRQGLTEEFIAGFPFTNRWGNPEQIARIELLESLFRRLPQTKQLYIDTMRAYGIGDTPTPAGRVAPGFVSPEPVAVGNVATLPDGASVRLDAPEQSVEFVAAQGPLDQVPTQHLWQAISENAGEGKRYQIIGESGGHIGMTRYQDTVTGQYLGLKYNPGETPYHIMWPDARPPGPLAEVMSNDVAVAVGFPDMNLRLIVNQDNTLSIATELAQSVYNSNIFDTFKLREKIPMGLDALGNELKGPRSYAANVSIDSRIRKAIFDDLVTNTDNNVGNYLFAEQPDGSFSVVPIDNELTFQSEYMPEWGARSNLFSSEAMNWSVRTAFFQDPDDLLRQIKQTVADVQSRLTPELRSSLEQRLKKRLDDVIERVTTNGTDPADVEGLIEVTAEEIDNVVASLATFATQPTDYVANMYFKIIKSGTEQI